MKILFICNEYPPAPHGGIGVFVKLLAEALIYEGIEVAVIGYDHTLKKDSITFENLVYTVRLAPKNYPSLKVGRFALSAEPILTRKYLSNRVSVTIEQFKPDLIESFDWSGPLWCKPSVPLIVRMHGANSAYQFFEGKKCSHILYHFEKKNLQMADHLSAVSNHIKDLTIKAFGMEGFADRVKVLYNFVDTEVFKRLDVPKNPDKMIYVGRLHIRKGLSELFKILEIVFNNSTNCFLEIAGGSNPEYQEQLLNILSPPNRSRVHFLGQVPHSKLPSVLNSALFSIVPSRAEAFGITAIESMACGTPVLMTDRASGPELIQDEVDGWLFDIYKPNNAAKKILDIIIKKDRIPEIAETALLKVLTKFSKKTIIAENINFYQSLIR